MRPNNFVLDYSHPLARGLSFASLGNAAGSSSLYDSSQYKNHREGLDASLWVNQTGRNAIAFDGSSEVHLGVIDNMSTGTSGSCTLMCRFKITGAYGEGEIHTLLRTPDWYGLYLLVYAASGIWQIHYGQNQWSRGLSVIEPGTWYHLAVTYNNVDFWGYVNGKPDIAINNPAENFTEVDYYLGSDGTGNYFGGVISDAMIWGTRALTAGEVSEIADPSNTMLSGLIREPGKVGDINDLEGVR